MRSAPAHDELSDGVEPTWDDDLRPTTDVRDAFAELTDAIRDLTEAYTRARPGPEVATELAARIADITIDLAAHEVSEDDQLSGRLWDRPGRGQTMGPVLHFDDVTPTTARAHVTFGRLHSGRQALNGGVTPMIFDEILSRLGNSAGRDWARTASLTVDYRAPAPIHRTLTVTGQFLRQDGRKRYLRGEIRDGETLIAEATGLWVTTTPDVTAPTNPTASPATDRRNR